MRISTTVNGEQVEAEIWPGESLLFTLRERLSFPGQPVSEQDGRFVIEWTRSESDSAPWLIKRYYRIPLPGTRLGPP